MATVERLDARHLFAALVAYRDALAAHRERINRLNVYPVPDGDTGTNMTLTMDAVVEALEQLPESATLAEVGKAAARGSLMGARGNSGVILSQLLRGFAEALAADGRPAPEQLAAALAQASDAAWQAVLRPVEGTILSVAAAAAAGAAAAAQHGADLDGVVEAASAAARGALERTPEQLPELKAAGVVDAGGAGLVLFLDALAFAIAGRPLPEAPSASEPGRSRPAAGTGEHRAPGMTGPRYEVMYLLEAPDELIPAFKDVWAGLGDSIVVVGGEGLWNCHIHTDDVGAAIEAGIDAGRPRSIRVTDLAEQVEEERWVREAPPGSEPPESPLALGPPPVTAVVAVAAGDGLRRIFRSLGVHRIVTGGQAMNPSTAELLAAIDEAPAEEVVVLPDNENVVPVAEAAAAVSRKHVRVVPTPSVVHGFAALMEYDPRAGADANAAAMEASASRIVAGAVTQAVRASASPAGPIAAGDWLGVVGKTVLVVAPTLVEAACGLIGKLLSPEHELVTLFEGEGATAAETRRVTGWLGEHRPDVEVEVHHGGQPLYPYLVSIE
jgi:DAK2 domain fusion protein YloV